MNEKELKQQKNLLALALQYLECGFSIIPVGINKQPTIPTWKEFQTLYPSEAKVKEWFKNPEAVGIAIITGKISNLVVLDTEAGANLNGLRIPATLTAQSGGGGLHFYFKHPGIELKNSVEVGGRKKIDFRGDGGYIIAPPSAHRSGEFYKWFDNFDANKIEPMPDWLIDTLQSNGKNDKKWKQGLNGVAKGSRNETAASLTGKLLRKFDVEEWETTCWPLLQGSNLKNNPPLSEGELRAVFDSIAKLALKDRESSDEKGDEGPFTMRLVKAVQENIKLFHDQNNVGYAAIRQNDRWKTYRIKSSEFSNYVSLVAWNEFQKAPLANVKESVVSVLEATANFEGEKHDLFLRVAWQGDALWYDLGEKAVKITIDGWSVVDDPPIIFKRFQHQKPQVEPVEGGSLSEILEFINLPDDWEQSGKVATLLLTYLVAVLIPDVPRPIIIVHGTPGAAKSTFFRLIKSLVDPSILDTMTYPRDSVQLIQMLSHHFLICFDNISNLTSWQSDELCKACTGQAFSKRVLFKDDDDFTYNYKVAIGLNGINVAATRSDLLDRSLIFELQTIPEGKRRSEEELWKRFEEAKPRILGAMFTALSKAIGFIARGEVVLEKKPRLADYAAWAGAVALGIGKTINDFLVAYRANIETQNAEALETSSVGQVIEDHMIGKSVIRLEGDAKHVYDALFTTAEGLGLEKAKDFPRDHRWLWRKIKPIKQNLEGIGILVEYFDNLRPRKIVIRNLKMEKDIAEWNAKNGSSVVRDGGTPESQGAKPPLLDIMSSETSVSQTGNLNGVEYSDLPLNVRTDDKAVEKQEISDRMWGKSKKKVDGKKRYEPDLDDADGSQGSESGASSKDGMDNIA